MTAIYAGLLALALTLTPIPAEWRQRWELRLDAPSPYPPAGHYDGYIDPVFRDFIGGADL